MLSALRRHSVVFSCGFALGAASMASPALGLALAIGAVVFVIAILLPERDRE